MILAFHDFLNDNLICEKKMSPSSNNTIYCTQCAPNFFFKNHQTHRNFSLNVYIRIFVIQIKSTPPLTLATTAFTLHLSISKGTTLRFLLSLILCAFPSTGTIPFGFLAFSKLSSDEPTRFFAPAKKVGYKEFAVRKFKTSEKKYLNERNGAFRFKNKWHEDHRMLRMYPRKTA